MKQIIMMLALVGLISLGHAAPPQKPEEALRDRVSGFCKALLKENYDAAVTFVDPDIVAEHGSDKVKDTGKHFMNFVRGLNEARWRKLTGFHIRKVVIASDKNSAVVDLFYYTGMKNGGAWREEFPSDQHWVLKKNVWYWTNK